MTFSLKIVTPDGLIFDGQAEKLIVRTTTGDLAVLARHINAVFPLGMGQAIVESEGQRRTAACIGGLLSVVAEEHEAASREVPTLNMSYNLVTELKLAI